MNRATIDVHAEPSGDPYSAGVWVPCDSCEDYWCTDHDMHAHECPCPPIEEWGLEESA